MNRHDRRSASTQYRLGMKRDARLERERAERKMASAAADAERLAKRAHR